MPILNSVVRNLAAVSPVQKLLDTLNSVNSRTNDSAINSLVHHDQSYLGALLEHHTAVYRNSSAQKSDHLDIKRRFVVSYEEPDPGLLMNSGEAPLMQVDKMTDVLRGQSIDSEEVTVDGVMTSAGILIRESALERIENKLKNELALEIGPSDNPADYRPSGSRRLSDSSTDNIFNTEYLSTLHMDVIECVEFYTSAYTSEDIKLCDDVRKAFQEDNLVSFVGDDAIVKGALVPDMPSRIADRARAVRNVAYFGFPNDRYYRKQWSHVDPNGGLNTPSWFRTWYQNPPAPLNVVPPFSSEQPIVVAIIDSGVNYLNTDLQESIYYNSAEDCTNGIDDDGNGYVDDCFGWNFVDKTNDPMDDNGHGTSGASLIAGTGSNQYGIAPFCWNCVILPIKALDKNLTGVVSNILKSVNYALVHQARISNNSYGGTKGFDTLEQGVARAQKRGMIFVASAGNHEPNTTPPCDCDVYPIYPATFNMDNVVSVASTGTTGALSPFSCYGKKTIHLAAPGEKVIAAGLKYPFTYNNGTSFSAPIVSGVIASIWNENILLTYQEVITILFQSVKKLPWLADYTIVGGIPDMHKAMTLARATRGRFQGQSFDSLPLEETPVAECEGDVCTCPEGFELDDRACFDIDECKTVEGVCGGRGPFDKFRVKCTNNTGGYQCSCREGFLDSMGGISETEVNCVDINECKMNTSDCPSNSKCLNVPGGVECICNESKKPQYYDESTNSCLDADPSTVVSCKNPRVEIFGEDGGCVCRMGYIRSTKGNAECVPHGMLASLDSSVYEEMLDEL